MLYWNVFLCLIHILAILPFTHLEVSANIESCAAEKTIATSFNYYFLSSITV